MSTGWDEGVTQMKTGEKATLTITRQVHITVSTHKEDSTNVIGQ